uniref:Carbonic anhydrase 2 n=1 Tax=Acartia pacifica TaxID=335913 RepID=R9TE22_ACAPC|nr:carbonic anhydrase 2 [Acartia pacifica]
MKVVLCLMAVLGAVAAQEYSPHPKLKVQEKDSGDAPSWGYGGEGNPVNWYKDYLQCGGKRQSPVNLPYVGELLKAPNRGRPLVFHYYNALNPARLVQSSKNFDFVFTGSDEYAPVVSGVGFNPSDKYQFAGLHLHWGSVDSNGAEHTLDGHTFPGEMHFVHFNKKYGSVENAINQPDGLVVIGFFLEISSQSMPGLTKMAKGLHQMRATYQTELDLGDMSLLEFIKGYIYNWKYYYYQGSLTTPPCSESVQWHVFPVPVPISRADLEVLRQFPTVKENFSDNNRPIQNLNGRKITYDGLVVSRDKPWLPENFKHSPSNEVY